MSTTSIHPSDDHEHISSKVKEVCYNGHVINVNFDKMSEGERSLERSFLSHLHQHFSKQSPSAFSKDAKFAQYFLNDILTVGRNLGSLTGVNQDTQNVLGEAGGALVGTGLSTLAEGIESEKAAKRVFDVKAQKEANIIKKMGATETAMGVTMVGSRSLNLASGAKGVNTADTATTSLGQATFALGMLGGVFSSVWYAFIGFSSWNSLKEVWRVEDHLKDPSEAIHFFKQELDFGIDKTLDVLEENYKKKYPEVDEEKQLLQKPSFSQFCKDALEKEALHLAKDFLQTINPDPTKSYDFEQAAEKLTKKGIFEEIETHNGNSEKLKELGLSPLQLIGFESLHHGRLELAKAKLSKSIGKEALKDVLEYLENKTPTEAQKNHLLESVNKGLAKAKTENMILLTFVGFGLAVVVASSVGACIACPPLGLIVACAVFSIVLTTLVSYVDLKQLLENWDTPVGELEEATNTAKFLVGAGCIVGICLLSSASLGTFPVALSLVIVSSVVITSLFRYAHSLEKRKEEKEITGSIDHLITKLAKLKENDSLSEKQRAEKKKTEEKIEKIIMKKFLRTHVSIIAHIADAHFGTRILQPITSYEIDTLREDIKKWEAAENFIIEELQKGFASLGDLEETTKPFIGSLKQAFVGVPHLGRIFPVNTSS